MRLIPHALRRALKAIPGAVAGVRWLRGYIMPHERALRRIMAEQPGELLQPSMLTRADRYPEFFDFLASRLAAVPAPRVLSFGCSSGEELLALRQRLPHAEIVGIDINPRAIAAARRAVAALSPNPDVRLIRAGNCAGLADASFDAIVCMAVLRHGDLKAHRPQSCAAVLPFARAERTVRDLARCLRSGGYLVIWNYHFRLTDMACAHQFKSVLESRDGDWANQPLYGADDRLLEGELGREAIFRKSGL